MATTNRAGCPLSRPTGSPYLASLLLPIAFSLGCSSSGEANASGPAGDAAGDASATKARAIVARWSTSCNRGDGDGEDFQIEQFEFRDDLQFDAKITVYPTSACRATDTLYVLRFTGTYAAEQKSIGETSNLDFTLDTFYYSAISTTVAMQASAERYCGLSSWVAGAEQAVIGLPCAGLNLSKGMKRFEIYKIENNRLFLGENSTFQLPGTIPSRATVFDMKDVFTRVN